MRALCGMAAVACLWIGGCGAPGYWYRPGPAAYLQAQAERFDPYPENEPGPRVEGSRPRDYQKPIPEVDRARWTSGQTVFHAGWMPWNWSRQ
jgi:hypothetical protein